MKTAVAATRVFFFLDYGWNFRDSLTVLVQ
jgi:hypothetical protein